MVQASENAALFRSRRYKVGVIFGESLAFDLQVGTQILDPWQSHFGMFLFPEADLNDIAVSTGYFQELTHLLRRRSQTGLIIIVYTS